ncbi:MAG TPA: GNAT family N-acetyltransferase [Tepidisphaeraceae bacterium]|jgi:GNAT superfamily N-acetyltransferase|nr:GNAT family N-acetyltransferase [Tepidisphaeraceae bacterium]
MLLPGAVHFGASIRAYVAATNADGLVVGAVVLSARARAGPLIGPRVAIHVIPPMRRQGIGQALLQTAESAARSSGASALYAWLPVDIHESLKWSQLGFTQSCHVQEFRSDLRRTLDHLTPLYEQALARNWVPTTARLVPLNRADPTAIARLHLSQLGGDLDSLLARLRGQTPPPYQPEISPVIVLNGQVVAFMLALSIGNRTALIESTVVDPSLRGRWANLWLRATAARRALELGMHTVLYYTYDQHRDSQKIAARLQSLTRDLLEPYRLL